MTKNIFVVGLDPFNNRKLTAIGRKKGYAIHALLDVKEVKGGNPIPVEPLLSKAEERIQAFSDRIDAIVGYWDFPVTCLAPFLCQKLGLPAAPFASVLKCENKYWCRLEQSKVIKEYPQFCAFDPFDPQALSKIGLTYPFWIKPIKAFASHLGFRIHNAKEFHESVAKIQQGISRFADPFTFFLKQVDLPPEVASIHGGYCLAEEIMTGRQCTLEGFVWEGEVVVYGIVDSIREPNRSTFARYEYPSRLPQQVQDRMIRIATTIMIQLQYDQAPFNIEMFYDETHDKISLLEINPRISQSHCDLFEKVDGASHHEVMIDLALGQKPNFPHRQGAFGCAAKFFFRVHEDGLVTHVPTDQDLEEVQRLFPGTLFNIHVKPGMHPSDLPYQESYSYELGYMFMGAKNHHELLAHHRKALDYLRFEMVPLTSH